MTLTQIEFVPSALKILGASSHPSLGRAMEIMLRAVSFGEVDIVLPVDVCKQATEMKPDFVLFTPEYLTCTIQEKLEIGCPCKEKKWCKNALILMLLKEPNVESVFTSKDMGFDSIIFADASVEKMYLILERAYLHHHRI